MYPSLLGKTAPGLGPAPEPPQAACGGHHRLPRPGWPAKPDLDYVKTGIEVVLLLLALPWLVVNLLRRPGFVISGAAGKHMDRPQA